MPIYQLSILSNNQQANLIEKQLFDLGALSVSYTDSQDQAIFEPNLTYEPLWDKVTILALFSENPDLDIILSILKQHKLSLVRNDLTVEPLLDQDWTRTWMEDYKPMKYGNNLWVVPYHLKLPDKNAINLRLDPGLAFGSGTHSTTRLCLNWIAKHNFKDKTVIDFGCGSGILGIAACLCGAKKIICTDIDPQALTSTKNNALNNKVADKIELCLPENMPKIKADIVLANILSGPLCKLKKTISKLCKAEAFLVLSGILEEQKETIITCYNPYFTHFNTTQDGNWVRIIATNNHANNLQ